MRRQPKEATNTGDIEPLAIYFYRENYRDGCDGDRRGESLAEMAVRTIREQKAEIKDLRRQVIEQVNAVTRVMRERKVELVGALNRVNETDINHMMIDIDEAIAVFNDKSEDWHLTLHKWRKHEVHKATAR